MRSVILGLSVFLLAGCATVSMVPGEATVETRLTENQSALRSASDEYCQKAVDAGWVTQGAGLFGLANTLINGKDETAKKPDDYAAYIRAASAPVEGVLEQIVADIEAARTGLASITIEARSVLSSASDEADRKDVMSYERALVRAQASRRAFAKAVSIAARRGGEPAEADKALAALEAEIDTARKVADGLADRYASLSRATS